MYMMQNLLEAQAGAQAAVQAFAAAPPVQPDEFAVEKQIVAAVKSLDVDTLSGLLDANPSVDLDNIPPEVLRHGHALQQHIILCKSGSVLHMAASMAQLFPHFTSLQSLKARGETTHVDYFGQCGLEGDGGSRPPRPTGGGGCCGGAAGGAPPKRVAGRAAKAGRKREAAPRNEWRTQGGQRIYYDADGKKSTGSDAFRKHAKHQVATKGASSSVTVPESAQDVAAAQAERLRAGAERMAARRGH